MMHHLHPNPDVDDMLRAANARAEAAEAERDVQRKRAESWQDTALRAVDRAETAERERDTLRHDLRYAESVANRIEVRAEALSDPTARSVEPPRRPVDPPPPPYQPYA